MKARNKSFISVLTKLGSGFKGAVMGTNQVWC